MYKITYISISERDAFSYIFYILEFEKNYFQEILNQIAI